MTKVLLSGASGFLGAIIKNALEISGKDVLGLGRHGQEMIFDITHKFSLPASLDAEMVIHSAGKAHSLPKNLREEKEFFDVNLEGTKNLCLALESSGHLPSSFIFISTVAVYGVDSGQNISEEHPLNGSTPYALSKISAEKWLVDWASNNDVTLTILRLPLIAGPNPRGNLGAMIDGLKSGKYLSIGAAKARKSIVWAENIAHIIPCLVEKRGIYNLTDGDHPTFEELENAIAAELNRRKPIKIPYWVARGLAKTGDIIGQRFPINSDRLHKITSTLTFDDTKAREQLGWSPTPVLSKVSELVTNL